MKLVYDLYTPEDKELQCETPVIMIHGMFDCRKTWISVAPIIANKTGRKVYAPDIRDHGDNPWSDQMHTNNVMMDFVEFMEDHNIPRAAFIGHSYGGFIAILMALRKPDKVEKLIVEEKQMKNSPFEKKVFFMMLNHLKESLAIVPDNANEDTARRVISDYLGNILPDTISKKGTYHDLRTMPLKKVDDKYEWKANMDLIEREIKSISYPHVSGVFRNEVLFLYGSLSFYDVKSDAIILKHFPNARKVCFNDVGHYLHQDAPEMFVDHAIKYMIK